MALRRRAELAATIFNGVTACFNTSARVEWEWLLGKTDFLVCMLKLYLSIGIQDDLVVFVSADGVFYHTVVPWWHCDHLLRTKYNPADTFQNIINMCLEKYIIMVITLGT